MPYQGTIDDCFALQPQNGTTLFVLEKSTLQEAPIPIRNFENVIYSIQNHKIDRQIELNTKLHATTVTLNLLYFSVKF